MDDPIKDLLIQFHKLPKYQLERRIDIFILKDLEMILSDHFGEPFAFLYPEFPLHALSGISDCKLNLKSINLDLLKSLKENDNNHNTNADYVFATKDSFYLVELKTDSKSFVSYKQIIYYAYYRYNKKFKELYDFFHDNLAFEKNQNKKWRKGFEFLDRQLQSIFKTKDYLNKLDREIKVLYILPKGALNGELISRLKIIGYPFDFKFITLNDIALKTPDHNLREVLNKIEMNFEVN